MLRRIKTSIAEATNSYINKAAEGCHFWCYFTPNGEFQTTRQSLSFGEFREGNTFVEAFDPDDYDYMQHVEAVNRMFAEVQND